MKKILRLRAIILLTMFLFLAFSTTSCMVVLKSGKSENGNNGKHKGWKKGKGNPHGQNNVNPWLPFENQKYTGYKLNGETLIVKNEIAVKMAL